MLCMWRLRVETVGAIEVEIMGVVVGMNLECCFLFLMEADITCPPGQTWPGMRKATGKV
jgi:hypothetical protein